MKEYPDPFLPKMIEPPVRHVSMADHEKASQGRMRKISLLRHRQAIRERYVKWLKKENPLLDAMGRWATGDVIRANPDPTFRLRRRYFLAQKWRELMFRNRNT